MNKETKESVLMKIKHQTYYGIAATILWTITLGLSIWTGVSSIDADKKDVLFSFAPIGVFDGVTDFTDDIGFHITKSNLWAGALVGVFFLIGFTIWVLSIINSVRINKALGSKHTSLVVLTVFNPILGFSTLGSAMYLQAHFDPSELNHEATPRHELTPDVDRPIEQDKRKTLLDDALAKKLITKTEYNEKIKKLHRMIEKENDARR